MALKRINKVRFLVRPSARVNFSFIAITLSVRLWIIPSRHSSSSSARASLPSGVYSAAFKAKTEQFPVSAVSISINFSSIWLSWWLVRLLRGHLQGWIIDYSLFPRLDVESARGLARRKSEKEGDRRLLVRHNHGGLTWFFYPRIVRFLSFFFLMTELPEVT